MDEMTVKALAKINIGLDVTGVREDGYHLVRMIMQTIHMYDLVTVTKSAEAGITMKSNAKYLPTNDDNLCVKAAKLLAEEFDLKDGTQIRLSKRIPVAAGMAGGSSDAAAVLYGMNQIHGLGLSKKQLMERGVRIGADVPYCLMRCPVWIAKPPISVSTKYVYEHLDAIENPKHPDIDAMIADITVGDLHALGSHMGNILEDVTIQKYPVIAQIKDLMKANGAIVSMMSGSGPTVFGFFEDEATLQRAKSAVEASGLANRVQCTTIYNNRR